MVRRGEERRGGIRGVGVEKDRDMRKGRERKGEQGERIAKKREA